MLFNFKYLYRLEFPDFYVGITTIINANATLVMINIHYHNFTTNYEDHFTGIHYC